MSSRKLRQAYDPDLQIIVTAEEAAKNDGYEFKSFECVVCGCFLQVENAQFCSEKCQGILPAKFSLQRNTFHRLLEAETLAGE